MVKKMKSTTTGGATAKQQSSHLAASVKDSAQQIWLAGMGAFSKAQAEGGKVFETLVKEGISLQKKTQGVAEDKISEVTGKMTAMADTVTAKAGQNWDKLEAIFEARTEKALGKLGVPTAKDVDALVERVDALSGRGGQAVEVGTGQCAARSREDCGQRLRPSAWPSRRPRLPARRARKTAASA